MRVSSKLPNRETKFVTVEHDVENLDSGRRLLSTVKFILVSLFPEVNADYLTLREAFRSMRRTGSQIPERKILIAWGNN